LYPCNAELRKKSGSRPKVETESQKNRKITLTCNVLPLR
jgi:hypothetical protein